MPPRLLGFCILATLWLDMNTQTIAPGMRRRAATRMSPTSVHEYTLLTLFRTSSLVADAQLQQTPTVRLPHVVAPLDGLHQRSHPRTTHPCGTRCMAMLCPMHSQAWSGAVSARLARHIGCRTYLTLSGSSRPGPGISKPHRTSPHSATRDCHKWCLALAAQPTAPPPLGAMRAITALEMAPLPLHIESHTAGEAPCRTRYTAPATRLCALVGVSRAS